MTKTVIVTLLGGALIYLAPTLKQCFWVSGAGHNNILWLAKEKY